MKSRLLLNCDDFLSTFSLTIEGQSWRRQFYDLNQVLDFAARVVKEETRLIVHNESGRVIIESFVAPAFRD